MTLENKVGQEKPDWKQWLPLWGMYQVNKDAKNGKPTIMDDENSWKYNLSIVHQAISFTASYAGLYYAFPYLADKF